MKKAIAVFVLMAMALAFADNPHITQLIELVDVAISLPTDGDVLTYNSAAAKWENKPAAAAGPKIVARFDADAVTDRASAIPLFTPSVSAIYRITSTAESATNIGSPIIYDVNFTGLSSGISPSGGLGGNSQIQKMYVVRLNAGQEIFFDTTGIAAGSISIHFVVEQL
jgi:hypothetical protein